MQHIIDREGRFYLTREGNLYQVWERVKGEHMLRATCKIKRDATYTLYVLAGV